MSQESVEIIRRSIDAINRGDSVALLRNLAPSFKYDASRAIGPWRGVHALDAIPELLADLHDMWESTRYEADEFVEVGDQVVTPFTHHLRGRDGIEVKARAAFVWTTRDGKITRIAFYQERQEALEAAGLEE